MLSAPTKKLLNSADTCVDENLIGFVASHPNTRLLEDYRVVLRHDIKTFCHSGKVAVICGGGSGHEPVFAGYVGRGGLAAAVAGSVFTSPPPSHILAAIRACRNSSGTLLLVFNYTGDRLNFGIALERAKAITNNGPVRMVIVGDDCALTSTDKSAGRRGLAGGILAINIAGAMSEAGCALDDIVLTCESAIKNMGTIGVSLSSCSLPGRGPIFSLGADEMELGLGVHGEPGIQRMQVLSAQDVVSKMLARMTDKTSATRLILDDGDSVAVLVNSLGGTSQLEMNVVCYETLKWLTTAKISVLRFYCGTLMTSLEMQGVSISVLRLNDLNVLGWLDAPTENLFPRLVLPDHFVAHTFPARLSLDNADVDATDSRSSSDAACLNPDVKDILTTCLRAACESLVHAEAVLNELDEACGDGDCGTTMKNGAESIVHALQQGNLPLLCPSRLLETLSLLWESNTGGTAGGIYSLLLSSAASELRDRVDSTAWLRALMAGTQAVMKYGHAEPGDRTLIDPLTAASTVATRELTASSSVGQVLDAMASAAEHSAQSTKSMIAKAGRASYVARANLTKPDPGAVAVACWMRAIADAYAGKASQ